MKSNVFTTLAILGLATHGAYAQSLTLQSGDHITVDGTGTHGVMKGRRVDNKITSYMSHGKVFGVDNDAVQVNDTATSVAAAQSPAGRTALRWKRSETAE